MQLNKETLYLYFLLFGYIVSCSLSILFCVGNSQYIAIIYRSFVFFFSILIILQNFKNINFRQSTIIFFLLFWAIYFFKMIYSFESDFYLPEMLNRKFEFLSRIPVVLFFPCLALFVIDYKKIDYEKLIKITFWSLLLVLLINFLYVVFISGNYNRSNGVFSTYYITSGHYGLSLVIVSSFLLLFNKKYLINSSIVLYIGIILGLFAIFISAARSPLLSLFIIVFYFLLLKRNWKVIIVFPVFLSLFVMVLYFIKNFTTIESEFVKRNYVFFFNGNISGREWYLERGIKLFLEHPILGDRVMYEDGMYPHNIFIDILVSGGIILFLCFIVYFSPVLKSIKGFLFFNDKEYYIFFFFFFFMQYFLLSLTSYNIVSSPEFWYFSTLIISLSLYHKNAKIKSDDGGRYPSRNN